MQTLYGHINMRAVSQTTVQSIKYDYFDHLGLSNNHSLDWLQMQFPGRLISNKSDFVWPPRSPDLNPCDFFLWGYMKEEIHRAQPGSTEDVKQKIREFMAEISEDLLQRVNNQFMSRVGRCIAANGGLFE